MDLGNRSICLSITLAVSKSFMH
uniref:Uncharacterized protein n=1 Tax=Rhizophora mucronata TaxID=61149 RepID=A0A2P2MG84_RHIMU